jgi:carbon storage regulator
MLVLKLRKEESIVIAGCIKVTVTKIGPDFVKLGIVAPRGVTVHREEVQERIDAANETQTQGDET